MSEMMSKSNGNIAPRPQSLNLSLATSAVSLPSTPSIGSSSSSAGSQRSSISGWPNNASPTTNQSIMIGSKASDSAMMKNANDIAKMNMKNSAMSSAAALSEKQLLAGNKGNNGINQSISKNLYTSFCEIKTETYPRDGIAADNNGANKTNSTQPPPPLPRKSSVLRRYLLRPFEASIFMQFISANTFCRSSLRTLFSLRNFTAWLAWRLNRERTSDN